MYELFYKYLILTNKAIIPGVGNFSVQKIPAKLDFVTKTLIAPAQNFNFNEEHSMADKDFYNYLAREMKVEEVDAVTQFQSFASQLKETAFNGGIELPGLGTLKNLSGDNIYFFPEYNANSTLQSIQLNMSPAANANLVDVYDSGETQILTQEVIIPEEEKIRTKEKEDFWWVYAIILAIMGLGALLFYYI
jgi:hypothetical protein